MYYDTAKLSPDNLSQKYQRPKLSRVMQALSATPYRLMHKFHTETVLKSKADHRCL